MLLQIDDTYIPISNIVGMKKADGKYAVTFWSPRATNGEPFLRTVIISGEPLYELESWLAGQIVVKLNDAVEVPPQTGAAEVQRASSRKSGRMPAAAASSRRASAEPRP